MNFVKIVAKSSFIDLRLFVKEADCYKVLQTIREIHFNIPVGFNPYRDKVELSVSMRRVIIANEIARKTRGPKRTLAACKIQDLCENAFVKLNELAGYYKRKAA